MMIGVLHNVHLSEQISYEKNLTRRRGLYIGKYPLSANVIWGKKYEKAREKGGKCKKGRKGKNKKREVKE